MPKMAKNGQKMPFWTPPPFQDPKTQKCREGRLEIDYATPLLRVNQPLIRGGGAKMGLFGPYFQAFLTPKLEVWKFEKFRHLNCY